MSDSTLRTKWVVAGLALGGVVVVSLIVLVASLGGDSGTEQVETTTSTTSTTAVPTTTRPSPGPDEPDDVEVSELTLQVGGAARTAMVIAPAEVGPSERLGSVVVLHGLGVNAMAMSRTADWRAAVAEDRFIAVFPQGVNDSWNMGPCCPPANLLRVADTAFMDDLLATLTAREDVDADRMYLTGFSNGALFSYAYACDHPEAFAAIAPMAGTNVSGCRPERPVSLLHQHGDADLVVPYQGGIALGSVLSAAPFPPVQDSVAAWAAADGCSTAPVVTTGADVVRRSWTDCAAGTRVELVTVPGKGHVWPTNGEFDPLDEMLRFFDLR